MTFGWLLIAVAGIGGGAIACGRFLRWYGWMAVAGPALILLLHTRLYLDYTPDDAYISYRYAQNLADGIGPFWNAGERVEGYSNFLWMALLGGFAFGGVEPVISGRWLGLLLAAAGCLGCYRLTRALLPEGEGGLAGLIAALLLACSTTWALWGAAGLEGPLFAALTLAAVLLHLREARDHATRPFSGVVWALVSMTRLDGLVLVAVSALFKLCGAAVLVRSARQGAGATVAPSGHRRAAEGGSLRQFAFWACSFALVFVPYFGWRWATYGWLMPNTYYAKVGSGFEQYERGIRYSVGFLNESGAWALVLVPIALVFTSVRRDALSYVAALSGVWIAYISYVGGDFMLHYRFFAPMLPLAFAAVAASVSALHARIAVSDSRPLRSTLTVAGAATLCLVAVFLAQPSTDVAIGEERDLDAVRNEQGRWLRDHLPADTTIAVYSAGAIPYRSQLPAIDILGLNDEHIAHRDTTIGAARAGHEKYDSEYVLDRQPEIIVLADFRTGSPWEREDYEDLARYTTIPGIADMIRTPRLWVDYEPRAYRASNGLWFNMLVNRQAEAVLAMTQAGRP